MHSLSFNMASAINKFKIKQKKEVKDLCYGFTLKVWGELALFSRPEMKTERVSYDVNTPSVARGILEAVYWKPAIKWVIDRIHVKAYPVYKYTPERGFIQDSCRQHKIGYDGHSGCRSIYTTSDRQQRASPLLSDVRYVIEAHFEMTDKAGETDTAEKHYNVALRRMRNGRYLYQQCFCCREFPANFRLIEGDVPMGERTADRDLGYMLFDMDFSNARGIRPVFFRAALKDGVIDLADCGVVR